MEIDKNALHILFLDNVCSGSWTTDTSFVYAYDDKVSAYDYIFLFHPV